MDCKIGGAIKITPAMYQAYIGAKIIGVRVGWCNPDYSSSGSVFLRKNLTDKEDILSGKGTLKYVNAPGNSYQSDLCTINFSNPDGITLTEDLGEFYVGYYADKVKAGTIALATDYPVNQAGSAYIFGDIEGVNYDEDGNEIWEDYCDQGTLCVDLIVQGTFTNKMTISNFITYPSMIKGEPTEAYATVTNNGTNSLSSMTLRYQYGDEEKTEDVKFESAISPSESKTVLIPAYGLGTGKNQVSISKVGGKDNTGMNVLEFQTVAVPAEVAAKYARFSLMEFWESENSYYVPRYYDELVIPGWEPYADSVNIVSQHVNDQWMTGDDEETQLMVDLADGNKGLVNIPAQSVDRSPNVQLYAKRVDHDCVFHGTIYPMFAPLMYEVALARPTYASIQAACEVQGDKLQVTLTGDIAEGVTDEQLYVTAYVLEDSVYTDSQEQSDLNEGDYFHDNLQRVRLTALWGDPIPVKSGQWEMKYDADLYPEEWKLEDMRIVAMVNRGKEGNDRWNHDIINSTSVRLIPVPDGISNVENELPAGRYYDLQGRRVLNPEQGHIYMRDGKKVLF